MLFDFICVITGELWFNLVIAILFILATLTNLTRVGLPQCIHFILVLRVRC
eukprot:gene3259-2241_t